MKTAYLCFVVPVLLGICLLGLCSYWLGLTRLEAWCARQLTDTDGQPET
ncbi:MAG: hypothetical protein NTZ16_12495 [Verrucomicrobia bacterium]|nr:hypothetical protein [Verrucomicrobiota bacterium]